MGSVRTKLFWLKYGALLFLALYAMRFYWVESRREYSQSGVLRVLFDTVPEIREKKSTSGPMGLAAITLGAFNIALG